MNRKPVIALIGNPNSGKSSLFNQLTGLRQKVGNFSGVTVEKRTGNFQLDNNQEADVIDFPGVYSLYPHALDEKVVIDVLANPLNEDYPDVVVIVLDASNLKRHLLLYSQISDLGFQVVLALNMTDIAKATNQQINAVKLAIRTSVPVVSINARKGDGVLLLKKAINEALITEKKSKLFFDVNTENTTLLKEVGEKFDLSNPYLTLQYIQQHDNLSFLSEQQRTDLAQFIVKNNFNKIDFQAKETIARYNSIDKLIEGVVLTSKAVDTTKGTKLLDSVLLHPFWGYTLFLIVLLAIFQVVFTVAQPLMDLIDNGVGTLNDYLKATLPPSQLSNLLTDGLIAGIGGIVIFIPQIALLFLLIALLEESGYMARVMVIMDKLMRKFGLNGRSVVPLISGVACAVPAILSTRSISNRKDRLLTIMVTPLMSCSARLPIYTILIALVVPERSLYGIIGTQALTLLGLYLLGLFGALGSAWFIKKIINIPESGYFLMEMPTYKWPRWNHVGVSVWDGVKSFVHGAGKVIVAISIVLWVASSYGPGNSMQEAENIAKKDNPTLTANALANMIASKKLESSYAGRFGKWIEPAISPLGYDWKIGVSLLASFTAREVFVGTLSTIYSLGNTDDHETVRARLQAEIDPKTGKPLYTPALATSLLLFYVFAMMCTSTLATTYRETRNWKWPMLQFVYMTALAYLFAFVSYQLMK